MRSNWSIAYEIKEIARELKTPCVTSQYVRDQQLARDLEKIAREIENGLK